jgi:hypothetical protein
MIHTVYIDDSSAKGKELLHNLQKERGIVRFEKPINFDALDGYMTGSEFRATVKQGLINKLKSSGHL